MATYEQAVEALYAEAWDTSEQHSDWVETQKKKEENPASNDLPLERIEGLVEAAFHRSTAALRCLGQVLVLRGDVGTRSFMQGRRAESKQAWVRLMQWGIARGLETQEALDETLAEHTQHRIAAANLGKDYEEYQAEVSRALNES